MGCVVSLCGGGACSRSIEFHLAAVVARALDRAPQPHNFVIGTWRAAVLEHVANLPDNAVPCDGPNCADSGRYVYHLPQCVLGMLYEKNAAFRLEVDRGNATRPQPAPPSLSLLSMELAPVE